jgi:hypothetical protein
VFLAAVEHLLDHQRAGVVLLHQAAVERRVPNSMDSAPRVLISVDAANPGMRSRRSKFQITDLSVSNACLAPTH